MTRADKEPERSRRRCAQPPLATTSPTSETTASPTPLPPANPDGSVPLDEEHFPDENLRRIVKNQLDTDGDDLLNAQEIANATGLTPATAAARTRPASNTSPTSPTWICTATSSPQWTCPTSPTSPN